MFYIVFLVGQLRAAESIKSNIFQFVDFDAAILCNQSHDSLFYEQALAKTQVSKDFFAYARKQYNVYIQQAQAYSNSFRIPNIIHQIWLGSKEPPLLFNRCQKSWIKYHPDWEYKLWTDKDVKMLKMINQQYYDEETNYGAKSDILRLEILNQFGGIYVDVDFECLKPFDSIHHLCDFYIGFFQANYLRSTARMNNALIAAQPGHPLIKVLIDEIANSRTERSILERTGPDFVTKVLHNNFMKASGINIVFPSNYFYPWTGPKKNLQLVVMPETFAIHYYASSWSGLTAEEKPHLVGIRSVFSYFFNQDKFQ